MRYFKVCNKSRNPEDFGSELPSREEAIQPSQRTCRRRGSDPKENLENLNSDRFQFFIQGARFSQCTTLSGTRHELFVINDITDFGTPAMNPAIVET
jgi:hypothetical protein